MINIRKRGKVYQYCFEAGKVNGKRKQITKCGFKTKNEAYIAGQKAYDEFINGVTSIECNMLYGDYLDYWMKEYFEINFKYSTAKRYKETFKVLKEEIGKYKLSFITPYLLNQSLLKIAQKCKKLYFFSLLIRKSLCYNKIELKEALRQSLGAFFVE